MNTNKFYDNYWTSAQHVYGSWSKKTFETVLGPLIEREAVLDYGCGFGYAYQSLLAAAVKRYIAADVSEAAVNEAKRKGYEAHQIDHDTGRVDLSDASIDGAVCSEVLEHLFDPLQAARELHRMLKPGGVVIVTVPNFGYHAWRLQAFLRAQVPSEPENVLKNRYNGVHIRYFSKLMLVRLLRDAGFSNIKIGSFDEGTVWDVFRAAGPLANISMFARRRFPRVLHFRFLEDLWPNVFAYRLRAIASKP